MLLAADAGSETEVNVLATGSSVCLLTIFPKSTQGHFSIFSAEVLSSKNY